MYNSTAMEGISAVGTVLINAEAAEPAKNAVRGLYEVLNEQMQKPEAYGKFHIISLLIILALTIAVPYLLRNVKGSTLRWVLGFVWVLMVVTEVLEKFVLGTTVEGDILVFRYLWGSFPYQLCATGLWVLPFILIMHECKARDCMMIYMGLYSFFGGLLVCLVPVTVYSTMVIVNVHTMIQHGSQVIIGVLLLVHNRRKLNIKSFAGATAVFGVLVCLAIVMNEVFYHTMAAFGNHDVFNMFYISRYYNSNLPVFGVIYELVPWVVFVILYVIGFVLISFAIYFVAILSIHIAEKRKYRHIAASEAAALPSEEGGLTEGGDTA